MKNYLIVMLLAPVLAAGCSGEGIQGFDVQWKRTLMDESRTGADIIGATNVEAAAGRFDGEVYVSPNGRRFRGGSTPLVARVLLDAQPRMAHVKNVIGRSAGYMKREAPECALSDMYVDELMRTVERLSGKKVHFGLANFGGIRTDMPKGDIILDDILSMFPFRNYTCYVALKGRDLRALLEQLAATPGFQAVGGVRCVVRDGKLVSATIDGGKPIYDNNIYGVATISFLLNGGDNIYAARNAVDLKMFDVKMSDFMVDYVKALTAEGRPIEYHTDGRVTVEE